MSEPAYSTIWQATVSGVTGASLGYALVWDGTNHIPATTAARALYADVMAVVRETPAAGLAVVQSTGPLPRSITGFSASSTGWAIVGATGALTFTATQPVTSDYVVGRVVLGLTHLTLETETMLGLVTAVAAEGGLVNVVTYGADPTGLTDSTAAILLAIAALRDGYTLYFPAGVYITTATLVIALRAIRIEGAGTRTSSGIFSTEVRFTGVSRTGSAGSLTKMFVGTGDATYTYTHFHYLKLTNATGLVASDKGKRMRLGAVDGGAGRAAQSPWNVEGIIVQIDSASQCIIAVPYHSNDATIAGAVDGNNGSIRWEVSVPAWQINGRDCTMEGLASTTSGGATVQPSAHVSTTYSLSGSVATHFRYNGVYMGSADGVAKSRRGTEQGADFLPSASNPRYTIEGTYERPFVPYQNDYNFYEYCLFENLESAHTTGNPTGQCRGNDSSACGYNAITNIVGQESRFLSAVEWTGSSGGGSMALDVRGASGGQFTGAYMFDFGRPNAASSLFQSYFEGTVPGLARSQWGTVAEYPFTVNDCYFDISTNTAGLVWIDWINGPFSIVDSNFIYRSGCAGMTWRIRNAGAPSPATGVICRSLIPSAADLGGELCTILLGAATGSWKKEDCRAFTVATNYATRIPDVVITNGMTTEGGKYLQKVLGLSKSWTAAQNLWGTVTITGAATSQAVTFGTNELDASFQILMTASDSTGTPAAGSYTPKPATAKAVGGFTANSEVAPGVGNSVTYTWMLLR